MLAGIRASFATLALVAPALVGAIEVPKLKVALTTPDGINDVAFNLRPDTFAPTLSLVPGASIRMTTTILEKGEPFVPAQAFVELKDRNGETATLAVGVKENGKANLLINADNLPPRLRELTWPLDVTLLLSSPGTKPLKWATGDFRYDDLKTQPRASRHASPRAGEPAFVPMPEITHTFRPDEKMVGFPKAALGVLALILPWGILFALISNITAQLNFQAPPSMMYGFLGCLVGLEGLILRYWFGWRLYQLLPPFLALSGATAYVGTVALRGARVHRLKAGGTP